MLTPYRRHLRTCPHRSKGQAFSLCGCPIWVYGALSTGQPLRQSLKTTDWPRALQRIENIERSGDTYAPADFSPKLAQACAEFLASRRADHLQKSTIDSYTTVLDHLRRGFQGILL